MFKRMENDKVKRYKDLILRQRKVIDQQKKVIKRQEELVSMLLSARANNTIKDIQEVLSKNGYYPTENSNKIGG